MTETTTSTPIPVEQPPLISAGAITSIRFPKDVAEKINRFAAMRHIEQKTDAIIGYITALEGGKIENPKEHLSENVYCQYLKRLIKADLCKTTQNSVMFEQICSKVTPRCKEIKL